MPSNFDDHIARLKKQIGFSEEPVRDRQGFWTIGYGERLNDTPGGPKPYATISEPTADEALRYRMSQQGGSGHDVSNEARIPKGQPGGGEWTSNGSPKERGSSRRLANSRTPAPFADDNGNPVLDADGKPMQRPDDVDMRFFVDQGRAAAAADSVSEFPGMTALGGLVNFGSGGPWDIQRVGTDKEFVGAFTNAANVAIGLYGAAAGIPEATVLEIANGYAALKSNFAQAAKDATYTHLRKDNVDDIKKGYDLYQSGDVGSQQGSARD